MYPVQVAQWRACWTHERVVVSLIPGRVEFSPLTSVEAHEKSSRWLWKEVVLVLVSESQETHMRHNSHDMTLAV